MNSINLIPVNATGTLNKNLPAIKNAFNTSRKTAIKDLNISQIDVLVFDYPESAIPELGIGGRTFDANLIFINVNPKFSIKVKDAEATLLHEFHHAARMASVGYGETFLQAMYSEGLACLYEHEKTGVQPIYTKSKITNTAIQLSLKDQNSKKYNHNKWFYDGDANIPRWFGYSYGYQLAKELSDKQGKTAAQLVDYKF